MAAAIVSGTICVFALKANNLQMGQLRNAVFAADEAGNNSVTENALRNLRTYVYAHMNTNLSSGPNAVHPPIQLVYTYERLSAATPPVADTNIEIYTQAQKYCEQAIPNGTSGGYRLTCIQAYVKQHGLTTVTPVPKELYQFDFVSAKWSPDLAGWSMVVTVLLALCASVTWVYRYCLRRFSHREL